MNIEHLKAARAKSGLTMQQAGEAIGTSKSTYKNYEYGLREPNGDTLVQLADLFGVTTDYLLGRTDEKPEPLEALAKEQNMHIVEKTMLAMYFKLDPKLRADFVEAMITAVQSADTQEQQEPIVIRRAARNGAPPSVETITPEEADEIKNRTLADPDM